MKTTNQATMSADDFANKSGELGRSVAKAALKMNLWSLAISVGSSFLIGWIKDLATAKQQTKELANDIKENYKTISDNISTNTNTVSSLSSDFEKLSKGVDDYGNNISLTNEQYKQYLDISKTLAEINPSLIKAYNSEGAAIIDKNSAIEKTLELLKEEQRLENIKYTTNKNLSTIVEDVFNDLSDVKDEISDVNNLDLSQSLGTDYKSFTDLIGNSLNRLTSSKNYRALNDKQRGLIQDLKEYFNNPDKSFSEAVNESPERFLKLWHETFETFRYADDQFSKDVRRGLFSESMFDEIEKAIKDQQQQLLILRQQEQSYYKSFIAIGQTYASTLDEFDDLDSRQQSVINSLIGQFDYEAIASQVDNDSTKFVQTIKSMIYSIITEIGKDGEISDLIANLLSIDTGKVNYEQYSEQVKTLLSKLADTEFAKKYGLDKIKLALGFSIETNDGQIEDEIDNIYNNVTERLLNRFAGSERGRYGTLENQIRSAINALSISDLKTLFNMDVSEINSLEELWNTIAGKTGEFSFKDYEDEIESFSKTLKTLEESLTNLSNNSLSAVDVIKLLEEFPALEEYVDITADDFGDLANGLIKVATASPDALIEKLESLKETMSDTSGIQKAIDLIKRMRDEALGLSKSGAVDYGKAKIQSMITDLEYANKLLEYEKSDLEKLSDKYSKAQSAVTTVLEDNINTLKERQTTVKDYYDSQIDLLKQENEEREKNIELQEKEKALDDAKRNKVRVYSAARGWTVQADTEAIKKAQDEYDAKVNEQKITDLENKRDKADQKFDKEIEAIEKYLDKWEKSVKNDSSTLEDKAAAAEIFGEDWLTQIKNGDTKMIEAFKTKFESNETKLFDVNEKMKANNAKIDALNQTTTKIEALLNDDEKGLSAVYTSLDSTNLNTSNIDTNLEPFYEWIRERVTHEKEEKQKETERQQNGVKNLYAGVNEFLNGYESDIDTEGLSESSLNHVNNMISRVFSTSPAIQLPEGLKNTIDLVKLVSGILPSEMTKNFAPVINSIINTTNVDENMFLNWFNKLIDQQASKYNAGNK